MAQNAQNYDYRAAAKPSILSDAGWENAPHSVSMKIASHAGRFNIRGSDAFFEGIARPANLSKPKKMLTIAGSAQQAVLWIGPDEYYVYTEDAAVTEKLAALARTPNPENSDQVGSIVDNSHRFVGFRIEGAGVVPLLSAYCPLDLSLNAFPIGKTTRSIMGKIDVLLWRLDEHHFHIEIARSFAQYGVSLLSFAQTNQVALAKAGLA